MQCKKLDENDQSIDHGEVSEEDESLDPDWRKLNRKVRQLPIVSFHWRHVMSWREREMHWLYPRLLFISYLVHAGIVWIVEVNEILYKNAHTGGNGQFVFSL